MWYFTWILGLGLGLGLALAFGILNALWFELREVGSETKKRALKQGPLLVQPCGAFS